MKEEMWVENVDGPGISGQEDKIKLFYLNLYK